VPSLPPAQSDAHNIAIANQPINILVFITDDYSPGAETRQWRRRASSVQSDAANRIGHTLGRTGSLHLDFFFSIAPFVSFRDQRSF
jgi:hypothetical protein